jgi:hypothetical protein
LHITSNCYTFVLKNQVAIIIKSVLINAYLFALVLISIRVFILSLLLLIVYKKVKESPLSNWLKFTLHKLSILYSFKVKTSFKGYYFLITLTPQVLRLPLTS